MTSRIKSIVWTNLLIMILIVAAAIAASPAGAANKKEISLTLDKSGYSVIAVSSSGKAVIAESRRRRFRIALPAKAVTLHLQASDGSYAGPIVIARKGSKKSVMGVKGGVDLGKVKVKDGFATVAKKVRKKYQVRAATAKTNNGIPIGVGKMGLVMSAAGKSAAIKANDFEAEDGGDEDDDGIPGAFDVDDDGDLDLDNVDAQYAAGIGRKGFRVFSNLKLELNKSLNWNALPTAMNTDLIDGTMRPFATLAFAMIPHRTQVELDCGGLSYCSAGGTGKMITGTGETAFPDASDADGDGLGEMVANPSSSDFQLRPGASSSEISNGDMFFQIPDDLEAVAVPGVLNFIFNTNPAIKAFGDGTTTNTISYPPNETAPGTQNNPITVAARTTGSDAGDFVLDFEVWRPQRQGFGGEPAWVDVGRLLWTVDIPNSAFTSGGAPPMSAGPGICPNSTYSTTDTSLKIVPASASGPAGMYDQSGDEAIDPARTLKFSVNLTDCLAAFGGFSSGQSVVLDIQARSRVGDNAAQKIVVKRA